jgi:signal recognition particle subunit SRP54
MGAGRRPKGRQPARKGKAKRVSGNPAKRAADQQAAARKVSDGMGANPFGVPAGAAEEVDPSSIQLPADLSKYLK